MPEYFSHDFNARNDPKMIRLIQKMGHEGIGLYWCLVEYLYEQRGYLMLSECDCIAFEMHTHCDKIKMIVTDFDLFENDGIKFWSDSVLKRIDTIIEKSGKARKSAEIRWKKGNINANAMRTQCDNDANVHQSKVNKEKEIKENKPKEKNSDIEKLYSEYPKHVGYGEAIKSIEKALKKESFETLIEHVKKYAVFVKDKEKKYIPLPATWFNQERWKDELIKDESQQIKGRELHEYERNAASKYDNM